MAALVWISLERIRSGKPSALGFATGAIAGLAAITPAAGSVGPLGALAIGAAAGGVCYWAATSLKRKLGYDDALDVVGVHGFGGALGTIMLSVFGAGALMGNLGEVNIARQFGVQLFAIVATVVYCGAVSFVILKGIDMVIGLRVDEESEMTGLDLSDHGEVGYDI
jgi:Amt family ammonium transporter